MDSRCAVDPQRRLSGSGQEAQVYGLCRDEQGSSFRLHDWCTNVWLDLIVLHDPGQSKVHLHLRQSLPHTGSHPDTEGDEAVRVMLVGARRRPAAATAGRLRTEPPLGEEELCVYKLCFIVTGCVMTKVELSLLWEPVFVHNHLVL